MDISTIQRLTELDNTFYRENAASFSSTRQQAWPGWQRVAASLAESPALVLDVACGNMRFKDFLDIAVCERHCHYYAVDSCPSMLPESQDADFQQLDIVSELVEETLIASLEAPACDLSVCFGFMHHVPTRELRRRLLNVLIEKTGKEGVIAVSLWRFAHDPKMLEKARATTERGCAELGLDLDEGDFLLGWNDCVSAYRYCHSFSEPELNDLVAQCDGSAALIDRFYADGRTGEMNAYLVFRKLV